MSKYKKTNVIYDILRNQFTTPITDTKFTDNSNLVKVRPPVKYIPSNTDNSDNNSYLSTPDPAEESCRSDRDCMAGEICLDGYCEPSSNALPDDDIISLPNNEIEPITEWMYIFTNIRACKDFLNDHNYTNLNITYGDDGRAEYNGTEHTDRPHLDDNHIERMCYKLRNIFLHRPGSNVGVPRQIPLPPVPLPDPRLRMEINDE